MGNYPSMGTAGGTVVGAMELNLCYNCPGGICKQCGLWNNCCADTFCPCCGGITTPKGPEWEAAKEGFKPLMEEAGVIALKASGCCSDVFGMKKVLDAEWTDRANTYLATHGLKVEVCAFYTSNGKSAEPHLVIQFSKTATV